ncbi:MAG: methyl-accepting chemotaxis protein [Solirubrobacteraceae bacterium]
MKFFGDLSIRAKLFGGFGVVLVVTAVLGVVMISQLGSVNGISTTISGNDLPSVAQIGDVQSSLNDYWSSTVEGIVETNPSARAGQEQSAAQDAQTIDTDLKNYAKIASPGQDTAYYHQAQAQWAAAKSADSPLLSSTIREDPATQALVTKLDTQYITALQTLTSSWSSFNQKVAAADTRTSASTYSSARTLGIGLLVLAVAIGVGIAFLISRSITRNAAFILERMSSIQSAFKTNLIAGLQLLAGGDLTRELKPQTGGGAEEFSNDELGQIRRQVEEFRHGLEACYEAYNQTCSNLNEIIGQVSGSAGQVTAASQEMSSTSEESGKATGEIANAVGGIAQGAERQVQMVDRARQSAEEVARAAGESAEHAKATAEVAHQAREAAQQGVGAAEQANEAMQSVRDSSQAVSEAIQELASKSEQIGAIVATITGIAEQTNLLALNAAIEAARAGEQGRGFAVVAEEVRKLAEDSQAAAHEISGLIGAIQTDTSHAVQVVADGTQRSQDGAAVVEQTKEAFLQIGSSVDDMTARIEQIAAGAEQIAASAQRMQDSIGEVAAVAEQSSAATEEVSASTEQTSASAEQIAASAHELSGNAETLNQLVSQFTLKI